MSDVSDTDNLAGIPVETCVALQVVLGLVKMIIVLFQLVSTKRVIGKE